ncbi:MAG TPA: hypothetical protein DCP92_23990 [Nitrospiraceae bacterium]|nr:hypothetical protein [Nitrospiraceae bacterium]
MVASAAHGRLGDNVKKCDLNHRTLTGKGYTFYREKRNICMMKPTRATEFGQRGDLWLIVRHYGLK